MLSFKKPGSSGLKSSPSSSTTWDSDWEDAPKVYTPSGGQIIDIWGQSGTGRTTLALTAKPPIAYFCFTEKAEGIIERVAAVKKVKWKKIGGVFIGDSEQIKAAAEIERKTFERLYYNALGIAATIIVDTHVEAWEVERLSEFGAPKAEAVKGKTWFEEWARVNNRWRSLINAAKSQKVTNVIFIGTVEDEYEKDEKGRDKKTGKLVRKASSAGQLVFLKSSISVETSKTMKRSGGFKMGAASASSSSVAFSAKIVKGWSEASEMEGERIEGEELTVPHLLAMCSGTDVEDWR